MSTLCLAVVLGRAGSVGLPGKNFLPLCGSPTIDWTLEYVLRSPSIDHAVVSTDYAPIVGMREYHGVRVIRRPPALCTNEATVDSAVRHAVDVVEAGGKVYDPVVILYANAPIRPDGLIDHAVDVLRTSGGDSVQSLCPVDKYHPCWMSMVGHGGRMTPYDTNNIYRRQDLPPLYIPDGGVIAVRRSSLMDAGGKPPGSFLGVNRYAVLTRRHDVIDIDDEADFRMAECVLNSGRNRRAR